MVNARKKTCTSCGQDVSEVEDFCSNCGAGVENPEDLDAEELELSVQEIDELISAGDPFFNVKEKKESKNIIAIFSMILSLIAVALVLMLFLCFAGGIIAGVAIIVGLIGLMNERRRGFAIAGISISIIAFVLIALKFAGILWDVYIF